MFAKGKIFEISHSLNQLSANTCEKMRILRCLCKQIFYQIMSVWNDSKKDNTWSHKKLNSTFISRFFIQFKVIIIWTSVESNQTFYRNEYVFLRFTLINNCEKVWTEKCNMLADTASVTKNQCVETKKIKS